MNRYKKVYLTHGGVYRAEGRDSEDRVILGSGASEEQAVLDCLCKIKRRDEFLRLPSRDQLSALVSQKRMMSDDVERSVKLIAEIILG